MTIADLKSSEQDSRRASHLGRVLASARRALVSGLAQDLRLILRVNAALIWWLESESWDGRAPLTTSFVKQGALTAVCTLQPRVLNHMRIRLTSKVESTRIVAGEQLLS